MSADTIQNGQDSPREPDSAENGTGAAEKPPKTGTAPKRNDGELVVYPKLKNEHKLFICKLIAQRYTKGEIVPVVLGRYSDEWEIDKDDPRMRKWLLSRVEYYLSAPDRAGKWQQLIETLREQWEATLGKEVRLWHKTARIEELARVFRLSMERRLVQIKSHCVGVDEKGNKIYETIKVYERDHGSAIRALEAIAKEKGDIPSRGEINVYGNLYQDNRQINQTNIVQNFLELDERTQAEIAVNLLRTESKLGLRPRPQAP